MSTVSLRSPAELRRAIAGCVTGIEVATLSALRDTAQWGLALAQRQTQRSGVSATRTFAQGWFAKNTSDGAILGNSAMHAVFVERGRRPGKMPPVTVIEEWIRAKRLVKMPRKSRRESRSLAIGRGPSGNISGAKQRARLIRSVKTRAKLYNSEAGRKSRQKTMVAAMALAIARKIAKRGTKGRWILRDLMPRLSRRFRLVLKSRLRALSASPPR